MGGMKPRKLRIVWSVAFAIAALAVAGLWVRSHWYLDECWVSSGPTRAFGVFSAKGSVSIARQERKPNSSNYVVGYNYLDIDQCTLAAARAILGFGVGSDSDTSFVRVPGWFAAALFGVFAATPWLRWRFSLRTLLIATTLVAVVLGVIVWTVK
jgi:hypothetical protein